MAAFSDLPGAVSDDAGVQHFGEPLREQRALERGGAIAQLDDRRVVTLTGPERLSWLHAITSQAVVGIPVGLSTEFLVLDVQGRVEHAAALVDDGETSWLVLDADDAQPLADWLLRMRFRTQVEIAVRDDLMVFGYTAGGSAEALVLAADPLAVWADPWATVSIGGWQYARTEAHPGAERAWREAIVPTQTGERLARSLRDVRPAGQLAVDALRIAAWRPRWANEARGGRLIPHEADWLRSAVHLEKGCYRGQEVVAKVHNLGHPPRRMVMLHLDGSDGVLPRPGDPVLSGEDEIGAVTSVAMHHELGPIALAIVSRRASDADDVVIVMEDQRIAAAQEVIVPADAGATANVPRITRLSRRPLKQD